MCPQLAGKNSQRHTRTDTKCIDGITLDLENATDKEIKRLFEEFILEGPLQYQLDYDLDRYFPQISLVIATQYCRFPSPVHA